MSTNHLPYHRFLLEIMSRMAEKTFFSDPTVTDATEQYPFDKVSVLVQMAKVAIKVQETTLVMPDKDGLRPWREHEQLGINAAMERLLSYINSNFNADMQWQDVVDQIFKCPEKIGVHLHDLDEAELSRIAETAVPVAVLRSLLKHHSVRFNSKLSSEFMQFYREWFRLIMG